MTVACSAEPTALITDAASADASVADVISDAAPSSPDAFIEDVGFDLGFADSGANDGGLDDAAMIDTGAHGDAGALDAAIDMADVGPTDASTVAAYPFDDQLRMNHVQVRGTHNSYHVEPGFPVHGSHRYTHVPLDQQLEDQHVRAFELDVHKNLAGELRVYHIAVVDQDTTCETFEDCLNTIRTWSLANPDHVPVFVWIEIKDNAGGVPIGDPADIDVAIRAVFDADHMIEPDDVQGSQPNLREAIANVGWPTLGEVRGKVMFAMINTGGKRDSYTSGHTTLAGRAMFARVDTDQFGLPWAAVAKLGVGDQAGMQAAHAAGLLVATNVCSADQDDASCGSEAQTARERGFHMLKDDIPAPIMGRMYWLELPGAAVVACNPVTAPALCTTLALERP